MSYLGNPPAEAFTTTVKDSFDGDGSTTGFTMSQPSVTNDVRVVVENVVQDPTVAYTCAGTTLTFTSAPPAGTGNIYVVHLGPAIQTAQPPAEISSATSFLSSVTVQGAFTSLGIDDNATSTAMTLDSSGKVGIGTSSPSQKFHIEDTSSANTSTYIQVVSGNTGNAGIAFGDSDADLRGGVLYNNNDDALRFFKSGFTEAMRIDSSGNVILNDSPASTSDNIALRIKGGTSGYSNVQFADANDVNVGMIQYNHASNYMQFTTNDSERMRIDSSGNLLVGKTSTSSTTAGGNIFGGLGSFVRDGNTPLSLNRRTNDGEIVSFAARDSVVGSISASGSSTSYNTSSDYRLKTDAQPMTGASARVQALNPVNFEWIANGTRVDGFLAHEAQEVVPEAVTGTKDAMRDEEYEVTPAVYEDVVIPAFLDEDGNEVAAERTEQQLVTEAVMGTRSVPDHQGIDQSKLVPLLTAALQEALTEITDLKARVAALEAV